MHDMQDYTGSFEATCLFFVLFVCEKLRAPVRSGDLVALFEPSEGPLEARWRHSWGTVSAFPFNMSKKP